MELNEKRFEYDIEGSLITKGGYEQFVGQDHDALLVLHYGFHKRQHDVDKCIYMDVLVEFIEKTQPKAWEKYKKYYGDSAPEKFLSPHGAGYQQSGINLCAPKRH
jgi:type I restriction enzyme R subunit